VHRSIALLLAAAAVIAVAGCATRTEGAAAPAATTATTASAATGNERGLISQRLGETVGFDYSTGTAAVTFSIDSVTVDPPCDAHGTKPESTHTLLLQARVATTSDVSAAQDMSFLLYFSSFVEIGKDGAFHTADPGSCIDASRRLPDNLEPDQTYSGSIELVVPEASGRIAIQDPLTGGGTRGWEWTY
jgi:hypothetical protein